MLSCPAPLRWRRAVPRVAPPALTNEPGDPVTATEPAGTSAPTSARIHIPAQGRPLTSEPPLADTAPLTSEPPLAGAAPLTSEPPLVEATPLTSEPTVRAAAGGSESPGV
ncbi:hypothetical protein [Streptomyces laurentii]|uniref:hypothetical protein n=1 Tax=Streptomyces laurentii TaxID=39478 RepID=UPI0036C697ED